MSLPLDLQQWAGIPSAHGMLRTLDTDVTLADLNDSGLTFNQIADVIEYFL